MGAATNARRQVRLHGASMRPGAEGVPHFFTPTCMKTLNARRYLVTKEAFAAHAALSLHGPSPPDFRPGAGQRGPLSRRLRCFQWDDAQRAARPQPGGRAAGV